MTYPGGAGAPPSQSSHTHWWRKANSNLLAALALATAILALLIALILPAVGVVTGPRPAR